MLQKHLLISFCDEIAGSADEGIAADVFLPDVSEASDFVSRSILKINGKNFRLLYR